MCVIRARAAVDFVITHKDLYGVGCGEGCGLAFGSVREKSPHTCILSLQFSTF